MESVMVSVIVPVGYVDEHTKTCLSSLIVSAEQLQDTYEIILVCNGLTNVEYRQIAHLFNHSYVKMLTYPVRMGPTKARTAGLQLALGQYFAFTDADCVVPTAWLHIMLEACQQYSVCCSDIVAANSHKNIYVQIEEAIDFFRNAVGTSEGQKFFCAYNSLIVKKGFLLPASEIEDNTIHSIETSLQYLQRGIPIWHVGTLTVAQFYPTSLGQCLRRRKSHAKGLAFLQAFPFSTVWCQLHMHTPLSYLLALPMQARKMTLPVYGQFLYLVLQTSFALLWQYYLFRYLLWKQAYLYDNTCSRDS